MGGQALGIAQCALEASIRYAKERVQFGKPLSSFQGWVTISYKVALLSESPVMLVK